ncbi:hypothetical protein EYF80_006313 [Liparis tanakae]|uniref:Uncharacterized protein n=1 Tax=Liparis tanakae TaxID=230148 RepID=A0A4Z2J1E5_9TELE|nr:hypothetical protein EYF80_006313 [Liparis tanakae]
MRVLSYGSYTLGFEIARKKQEKDNSLRRARGSRERNEKDGRAGLKLQMMPCDIQGDLGRDGTSSEETRTARRGSLRHLADMTNDPEENARIQGEVLTYRDGRHVGI